MIACPSCHQSVQVEDKHIGTLFTCPYCAAVYFINWDGQPEVAQHEEPANTVNDVNSFGGETPQEVQEPDAQFGGTFENQYQEAQTQDYQGQEYQPQENQTYDSSQTYGETPSSDGYGAESEVATFEQTQDGEQLPSNEMDYSALEADSQAADFSSSQIDNTEEQPFDFSQTLDYVEPSPVSNVSDNSNFSDVVDFANSNTQSGPLNYTLRIAGLDSSFLVQQVKEAMIDSRFGWNESELIQQISGGVLTLQGMSPAAASILINRIKYLSIKITWRQDVL